MGTKNRYKGIDPYAVKIIRYRARKLIGTAGYTIDDLEDIEQDLMIDLMQRMARFDEDKAQLNTFIDRIVDHKISDLIDSRTAEKRDFRKRTSASATKLEEREGAWHLLMETTSTDTYLERMGYQTRPMEEQHDLQIDLDLLFARFSESERQLLELLKRMTLAEAAKELGIPRTTLDYRLGRLRKSFIDSGLQDYLRG